MKNAQKKDILTRAVSTGVLTNSVFFLFCVSLNFAFFAENTKNRGFSQQKKEKKHKKNKKPSVKNWSKPALKTGPSTLRNKIGPVFNARNVVFFLFVFFFFLKNPLLSAGRMRFSKTKKTKKKQKKYGPVFNTRKGQRLDQFLTLQPIYLSS